MEIIPSNSLCVFCFKPQASTSVQGNFYARRKFLKLFSRYLNTNFQIEQLGDPLELAFCEECLHLQESFCELYFGYEIVKMRLDWKVEKLFDAMKGVTSVPSLYYAFANQFPDNVESIRILKNIQTLRRNLLEHCEQKMGISLPKVAVTAIPTITKSCRRSRRKKPTDKEKCKLANSGQLPSLLTFIAVIQLALSLIPCQKSRSFQNEKQTQTNEEEIVVIKTEEVGTGCHDNYEDAEELVIETVEKALPCIPDCFEKSLHELVSLNSGALQTSNEITHEEIPDLNKHHQSRKEWCCTKCTASFSTLEKFVWHEIKKHGENSESGDEALQIHQCTLCPELFTEKETIIKHVLEAHQLTIVEETQSSLLMESSGDSEFVYQSTSEKQGISSNSAFNPSISPSNPKPAAETLSNISDNNYPKLWLCFTCPASFATPEEFVWDQLINHGENLEFNEENESFQLIKCNWCSKSFMGKETTINHVIKYHRPTIIPETVPVEKIVAESQVSVSIQSEVSKELIADNLISELPSCATSTKNGNQEILKSETVFNCNFCGIKFKIRDLFLRHMISAHGKLFKRKSAIPSSGNEEYICPEVDCMVRCSTRKKLSDHLTTHRNGKIGSSTDALNAPIAMADLESQTVSTVDAEETMEPCTSTRVIESDSVALLINSIAKETLTYSQPKRAKVQVQV